MQGASFSRNLTLGINDLDGVFGRGPGRIDLPLGAAQNKVIGSIQRICNLMGSALACFKSYKYLDYSIRLSPFLYLLLCRKMSCADPSTPFSLLLAREDGLDPGFLPPPTRSHVRMSSVPPFIAYVTNCTTACVCVLYQACAASQYQYARCTPTSLAHIKKDQLTYSVSSL